MVRLSRGLLVLAGGWVLFILVAAFAPFVGSVSNLLLMAFVVGPLACKSLEELYPDISLQRRAKVVVVTLVLLRLLDFTPWLLPLAAVLSFWGFAIFLYGFALAVVVLALVVAGVAWVCNKHECRPSGFGLASTAFGLAVGTASFLLGHGTHGVFRTLWYNVLESLTNTVLVVYPAVLVSSWWGFSIWKPLSLNPAGSPARTPP